VVHLGPWPLEKLGVTWNFGRNAKQVERSSAGCGLTLDDGIQLAADLVLAAIGLRPCTNLAHTAGIKTQRGIVVNRHLQTHLPDLYAIGDCAEVGGHVLPYVQPLLIQVRTLAAILTGETAALRYPAMPVMVKTTAYPLAVLPPLQNAQGDWRIEVTESGIRALHESPAGTLNGFTLGVGETGKRAELAKQAAALLA